MNGIKALGRALRLRCPVCGTAPVMQSWLRARTHCSSCHFRFNRSESGYEVGSLAVNTSLTLVLLTLGIAGAVALGWPEPNWNAITIGMVVSALALPVAIFPFSKTLYLALDVSFRPPAAADFTVPPPA